jgi:NADPH:quinone reductase-like Zn-dependent oxidoreductase
MAAEVETWDLWYPGPGATGLPFARSRINANDAGDRVLVHAAPQKLQVTVRDAAGTVVATGDGLERHQPGPMSYLVRRGATIALEDGWPTDADIGRVVLLPGGEAGILKSWWNADDRKEWRWQVEFYNQNRT